MPDKVSLNLRLKFKEQTDCKGSSFEGWNKERALAGRILLMILKKMCQVAGISLNGLTVLLKQVRTEMEERCREESSGYTIKTTCSKVPKESRVLSPSQSYVF